MSLQLRLLLKRLIIKRFKTDSARGNAKQMTRKTFSKTNTSKTRIGTTKRNASLLSCLTSLLPKYQSGTGTEGRKMKLVGLFLPQMPKKKTKWVRSLRSDMM
jgi:hypothetical protein